MQIKTLTCLAGDGAGGGEAGREKGCGVGVGVGIGATHSAPVLDIK